MAGAVFSGVQVTRSTAGAMFPSHMRAQVAKARPVLCFGASNWPQARQGRCFRAICEAKSSILWCSRAGVAKHLEGPRTFNDQSFSAHKKADGLRIFCLGGSSSFGLPWGADTAFTGVLGDVLAKAHPDRQIEAVNASGISYAMHRLRILSEEILRYDPDILVIYSGHNEFVEPAFYEAMKNRSAGRNWLEYALARSHVYSAVRALSEAHDHVFTSGGIGPTHDDITADAIATAFSTPIDVRADALAILQAHYDRNGIEINDARKRMARIPDGSSLIDNPISAAPGFTLGNVHVMAGVPAIFEAMVASVLATLDGGTPLTSESVRLELPEGEIAGPLGEVAARFPELAFGSYPYFTNGIPGANVVIRGTDPAEIKAALNALNERLPERT